MFARFVKPVAVSSDYVIFRRPVEVQSSDGIDIVYTDKVEPLPKYDAYSVESLSAAGVPLQRVNPAVLDTVDVRAIDDFISNNSQPSVVQPPVDQPPVEQPPVEQPPVEQPPVA